MEGLTSDTTFFPQDAPLQQMSELVKDLDDQQPVYLFGLDLARGADKPATYPYYRMSTYEIYGSSGYEILCEMFLKYYAEKVPVCIAFAGQRDDYVAIWLMGKEACDPKTKSIPNSEPMGEILWCSGWPDNEDKEVK